MDKGLVPKLSRKCFVRPKFKENETNKFKVGWVKLLSTSALDIKYLILQEKFYNMLKRVKHLKTTDVLALINAHVAYSNTIEFI